MVGERNRVMVNPNNPSQRVDELNRDTIIPMFHEILTIQQDMLNRFANQLDRLSQRLDNIDHRLDTVIDERINNLDSELYEVDEAIYQLHLRIEQDVQLRIEDSGEDPQ